MKWTVVIYTVTLYALSASIVQATNSCAHKVQDTLAELQTDGGTEIFTLISLYDVCKEELEKGDMSHTANEALRQIHSYISSWEEMQKMLISPPESMKQEMIAYTSEVCHPFHANAATGTRQSCHLFGA